MKNSQKGFVMSLLVAIIAVLVIGGGVYIYQNNKVKVSAGTDNTTPELNQIQQQNISHTSPVTQQNNPITQPSISVIVPATGVLWQAGKAYQIKWQTTGVPLDAQGYILLKNIAQGGDYYVVEKSVSLNGGASSNYGGSRSWTVPQLSPSFRAGTYVIRIGIGRYEDYNGALSTYFDSASFLISTSTVTKNEQKVLAAALDVISSLASRDYQKLEKQVSPDGLSLDLYPRFSPTKNLIARNDVHLIPNNTTIYLWGYTDGKGDPINLTRAQFLTTYIYTNSIDYSEAPDVAVNKTLGSGNSVNTIDEDINGRTYVAFHFSGFDPKYTGMDWTTLYLIFDSVNGEYKIRGIAKDNWTI